MKTTEEKCHPTNKSYVELKYCERCGGLWLRAVGVVEVYCPGCKREMADMPPVSYESDGGEETKMLCALRLILEDSESEGEGDYEAFGQNEAEGVA